MDNDIFKNPIMIQMAKLLSDNETLKKLAKIKPKLEDDIKAAEMKHTKKEKKSEYDRRYRAKCKVKNYEAGIIKRFTCLSIQRKIGVIVQLQDILRESC